MNLTPVTDMLREQIGLAPESLGPTVLSRAVEARMRKRGLVAAEDYAACLTGDLQEFQALIDDLTVPETWFFRGGEVFPFLAKRIAENARRQPAAKRYRVLSVPCSTGEEPYSLAMALLELGVPAVSWWIDGVDLCARSIERARLGRFSDFSFRQTVPELRMRYFRPAHGGWQLTPDVASLVRFRQGNLLAPFFLAGEEPFDLIFCRNLLIYLNPTARQRVLETLDRMLAPQGVLCMGHAEPLEFLGTRYVRTGPQGFFLYQRRVPEPQQSPAVAYRAPLPKLPPPRAEAITLPPEAVDLLARARDLADKGQIDEALASCRANLSQSGSSAHLFTLMGVLHLARHEADEAQSCFQRALYLNPAHRDALTHLMLLCQEQGDLAQAARLRRRLDRVGSGGDA